MRRKQAMNHWFQMVRAQEESPNSFDLVVYHIVKGLGRWDRATIWLWAAHYYFRLGWRAKAFEGFTLGFSLLGDAVKALVVKGRWDPE